MFTAHAFRGLVLATGLATITSTVAFAKTHEVSMTAVETDIVIEGSGEKYAAWTFDGQMPGPVVRVTEGDTIKFTLTNPATNKNPHAMDFHAAEIDFLKNYGRSMPAKRSATPSSRRSRECSSITAAPHP